MAKKFNEKFNKKIHEKKEKAALEERYVNDFLIQLTYTIMAAITVLFLYNCRMFNYSSALGLQSPALIRTLFVIFAILTVIAFVKYKTSKKQGFKTFGIYMLISALGMFWCIGFEDFFNLINVDGVFPGTQKWMILLFWIIGASVPAEIIYYFVRMNKLKNR